MMFAVHVEEHARPDPFVLGLVKGFDPNRFDQEKFRRSSAAVSLDAVDEKVIRVQQMGHDQIVNPCHNL